MLERIEDTQKLSKSFKEAAGAAAAIAGPGKFKSIAQAAKAVRIKKAKRKADILSKKKDVGRERIRRSETGNRATTDRGALAKSKADPKAFSKESIDKGVAELRRKRATKEAAQKLTRKRKAQQKRIDKKK
jgi:hypothetical protein